MPSLSFPTSRAALRLEDFGMACPFHHPKKRHKASPQRRGWAAKCDQEARLQRARTPQGRNGCGAPRRSAAGGVVLGRDGPSRERRPHPPRRERQTGNAAARTGRRPSSCASDRHRRPRPARGSGARAARPRARSYPCAMRPSDLGHPSLRCAVIPPTRRFRTERQCASAEPDADMYPPSIEAEDGQHPSTIPVGSGLQDCGRSLLA